jgi:hypothetical protein
MGPRVSSTMRKAETYLYRMGANRSGVHGKKELSARGLAGGLGGDEIFNPPLADFGCTRSTGGSKGYPRLFLNIIARLVPAN